MNLYKYCSTDGIEIFSSGLIKLADSKDLNDPFDFNPSLKYRDEDGEHLTNIAPGQWARANLDINFQTYANLSRPQIVELAKKEKESRLRALIEKLNDKFGVLCLSSKWDEVVMWSHYAEKHKGFVIAFDTTSDFFKPDGANSVGARPVVYSETRPWIGLSGKNDDVISMVYTKSTSWQYESEHRLLVAANGYKTVERGNGAIWKMRHIPVDAIKKIFIGCKANAIFEEQVRATVRKSKFRKASICRLSEHSEKFRVVK